MDQEIDRLIEQTTQLLEITRRLAEENDHLRAQLAEAHRGRVELQQRIQDARERVEHALARLPALPTLAGPEH
jgi:uncharacterized protein (TIGR02449 family)